MADEPKVAYFSMEVALEAGMPTYSGGLGVLAGDMVRAAADLKVPMVAVTLLYRKGYFYQRLDPSGWQSEEPIDWAVEKIFDGNASESRDYCRRTDRTAPGLEIPSGGIRRV